MRLDGARKAISLCMCCSFLIKTKRNKKCSEAIFLISQRKLLFMLAFHMCNDSFAFQGDSSCSTRSFFWNSACLEMMKLREKLIALPLYFWRRPWPGGLTDFVWISSRRVRKIFADSPRIKIKSESRHIPERLLRKSVFHRADHASALRYNLSISAIQSAAHNQLLLCFKCSLHIAALVSMPPNVAQLLVFELN